jgi:DNA mismatch repair ATPase MutL
MALSRAESRGIRIRRRGQTERKSSSATPAGGSNTDAAVALVAALQPFLQAKGVNAAEPREGNLDRDKDKRRKSEKEREKESEAERETEREREKKKEERQHHRQANQSQEFKQVDRLGYGLIAMTDRDKLYITDGDDHEEEFEAEPPDEVLVRPVPCKDLFGCIWQLW